MRVGPSETGCRTSLQTASALRGPKNPGCEQIEEKGGAGLRQVWTRKANESEPSMRRRKGINAIETRLRMYAWDKAQKGPAYGLSDGRRRDGASLVQALVWNVGTECSDVKGEVQGETPRRTSVPMRSNGADWPVVTMKPGNAGGVKGPGCPVSGVCQLARGGVHV